MSFVTFLASDASIASENKEEYVYTLNVEGKNLYKLSSKTIDDKRETVKEKVRRMEVIYPGTILDIGEDTLVSLTCYDRKIVYLSYKNSPYKVKMSDFEKRGSIVGEFVNYFKLALKNYIYPDSKQGQMINAATRQPPLHEEDICYNHWPPYNEYIILMEDPIKFKWKLKGSQFSMEIVELNNNDKVYSEKSSSNILDVPKKTFKPGTRYKWYLFNEETGYRCNSTFSILSSDMSTREIKILKELPSLLPDAVDNETICRLQAGYLRSQGYIYNAWQWLERNGVSREYIKNGDN